MLSIHPKVTSIFMVLAEVPVVPYIKTGLATFVIGNILHDFNFIRLDKTLITIFVTNLLFANY